MIFLAGLTLWALLLIPYFHLVPPCIASGTPNGAAHSQEEHLHLHRQRQPSKEGLTEILLLPKPHGFPDDGQQEQRQAKSSVAANQQLQFSSWSTPSALHPRTSPAQPMRYHNNTLQSRSVQNLQSFTEALGGIYASEIVLSDDSQRPFRVGGDTFPDFASAAQRSCDNQYNSCADAANAHATGAARSNNMTSSASTFSVSGCDTQRTACYTAQQNAQIRSFYFVDVGPDPEDDEYELYCEP